MPAPVPPRAKRLSLVAALLLLGGTVLLILVLPRPPRDIREGATRITTVKGWYPTASEPFYHWQSDHDVLFIQALPDRLCVKTADATTGAISETGTLTDEFSSGTSSDLSVSPDSHYLLWRHVTRKTPYGDTLQTTGVLDLRTPNDRHRVKKWIKPLQDDGVPFWLPGSNAWFHLPDSLASAGKGFHVFDRDNPGKQTWYPGPQKNSGNRLVLLGQVPGGDWIGYWFTRNATEDYPPLELVRLTTPFAPKTHPLRESTNQVEHGETTLDMRPLSLSPDGTAILWTERYRRTSLLTRLLSQFGDWVPADRFTLPLQTMLWTSDLQGNHRHAVAFLPEPQAGKWPQAFQWLPDGKHLSFVYGGALYVRRL